MQEIHKRRSNVKSDVKKDNYEKIFGDIKN